MATYITLQEAIADKLRNSAIAGFTWGAVANPYYEEVPEPPDPFPFVQFDVADSEIGHTFDAGTSGSYTERYAATIRVVATQSIIASLGSPYSSLSVLYFLDRFANKPQDLDGLEFDCIRFTRDSWALNRDPTFRAPNGERVWIAKGMYTAELIFNYPSPL